MLLNWILNQLVIFFILLLPFVWGIYLYKYKIFTKIKCFINKKNIPDIFITIIGGLIVIIMIVLHGIVQNEVVQVFTAIVTVILFNVVKKGKSVENIFLFLGKHSTNIWLTHMFFYSVLFVDFVFIVRYPIAIFVFIMTISIVCSYVINFITKPIIKLVK
jgi:hypothetical protein